MIVYSVVYYSLIMRGDFYNTNYFYDEFTTFSWNLWCSPHLTSQSGSDSRVCLCVFNVSVWKMKKKKIFLTTKLQVARDDDDHVSSESSD